MAKLKLGIIADAGCSTGFSTVTHNVARYLQNTGDYDIEIIGINFNGRPNAWTQEFKIWSASLGGDLLGLGLIPEFIEQVKPDVFLMFQDFWHIHAFIAQCPPKMPGLVAYYPVDSPNMKGQFSLSLSTVQQVICYTEFGVQETMRSAEEAWTNVKAEATKHGVNVVGEFAINISIPLDPFGRQPPAVRSLPTSGLQVKTRTKRDAYQVIPHGIDTTAFFKMSSKYMARKMLGLPVKGFIIGNVNRNQSRKRQDLTMRAFAKFVKNHADAKLLLHCAQLDSQGWDLVQLADYYGIRDKVIFSNYLFPDNLATIEQLNTLYNALDVQINTGGGEGWGLTTFEGAGAGVPQIVPDWSATKEIWQDSALLTKVASVRHEPMMINTMQAVIDTDHLVEQLNELYDNTPLLESIGAKCLAVTQRPEYKWEAVGKQWDDVFKNAVGKVPESGAVAINQQGIDELKAARKEGKA